MGQPLCPLQGRQRVAGLDDDHLAVDLGVVRLAVADLGESLLDQSAYVGVIDAARLVGAANERIMGHLLKVEDVVWARSVLARRSSSPSCRPPRGDRARGCPPGPARRADPRGDQLVGLARLRDARSDGCARGSPRRRSSFSARFTTSRGCTEAPSMVPRNISSTAMSRWRLSRKRQPKTSRSCPA